MLRWFPPLQIRFPAAEILNVPRGTIEMPKFHTLCGIVHLNQESNGNPLEVRQIVVRILDFGIVGKFQTPTFEQLEDGG